MSTTNYVGAGPTDPVYTVRSEASLTGAVSTHASPIARIETKLHYFKKNLAVIEELEQKLNLDATDPSLLPGTLKSFEMSRYKEAFKEISVAGQDLFCFNHELNGSGGELSELKSRIKIAMDQAEAAVEKLSSPFARAESMIQVNGQLEKNLQEQKARQVAGTVERWSYGDPIKLGGFVALCQRSL